MQKNKYRKIFSVHRLVAKTFIPNPENKPEVNHINGNKEDNREEIEKFIEREIANDNLKVGGEDEKI